MIFAYEGGAVSPSQPIQHRSTPMPASSERTTNARITVAYDGAAYAGWQRQTTGIAVQQKIEDVLRQLAGRGITVHGAGRTDTGVHALQMTATFHWPANRLALSPLLRALNALLPPDIRILSIRQAPADFHARFSATGKLYRYRILNRGIADPFRRHVTWFIHPPLDLRAMKTAARHLLGKHDFSSMAANPGYARTTMVRRVYRSAVLRRGDEIHFEIAADGFLYKMVRTIVGTLVDVGLGRRAAESIPSLLASRDRTQAGKTAPAHGLFLVRVRYQHPSS